MTSQMLFCTLPIASIVYTAESCTKEHYTMYMYMHMYNAHVQCTCTLYNVQYMHYYACACIPLLEKTLHINITEFSLKIGGGAKYITGPPRPPIADPM